MYSWQWVGLSPETCTVKAFAKNKPNCCISELFSLQVCSCLYYLGCIYRHLPQYTLPWDLAQLNSNVYLMSPQYTVSPDNRYVTCFSGTRDPSGSHIVADVCIDNPGNINTLRTGDAHLRFYITTVQDGWGKSAFLTRACFPCTIHLIMQYIEPVSEWSCWWMFIEKPDLTLN